MKARMWQFEAISNYFILGPLVLVVLLIVPVAIALTTAASHPVETVIATLALYLLGAISFAVAKISVLRKGTWLSFGSKRMTRGNRVLYRLGYALMTAALFLHLGLSFHLVVSQGS